MRRIFLLTVLRFVSTVLAQQDPVSRAANQPVEPFRIAGNLFYVGASDVTSYLITTPQGHILIDGGFAETAPMIERHIEQLGYHLRDVRILLNTHAHLDHAGGLAELKRATGATLLASAGDAPLLQRGGHDDPQFGERLTFPPVMVDRIIGDGERVSLGGFSLIPRITPGHTPGCTTWTMTVRERLRHYDTVVIVGSPTVPAEYTLVNNRKYPDIVSDYRRTFAILQSLPCQIFLGSHGSYFGLRRKLARLRKGSRTNPFVDPDGYRRFVALSRTAFEEKLTAQSGAAVR